MRSISLLTTLALIPLVHSQRGEFTTHPNGLVYSEAAMGKLHHIVDSLNIRFRSCPADRVYRSLPHARVRHLSVQGLLAKQVATEMNDGVAWPELLRRHPELQLGPEQQCAFLRYDGEEGPMTTNIPISFSDRMSGRIDAKGHPFTGTGPYKGKWMLQESSYGDEHFLEALVITEEPVRTDLPERYGRLVQYVDCLIDTTQQVYTDNARWSTYEEVEPSEKASALVRSVRNAITVVPPQWNSDLKEGAFDSAYTYYVEERYRQMDSLAADTGFSSALAAAIGEVLERKGGSTVLEELASRYGNKADVLAMKRNRRVVGMCSRDGRPRAHALEIAALSAETINWDIFLRAHLDILNDKFDRRSDASYAERERETYVLELEELGISVPDLLLGSLLHADNTSNGHYTASANRTGRAITEAKEGALMAQELLRMIADEELDLYNRAIAYYAFLNYNGYLEDERQKKENEKALDKAMAGIPKEVRGKRR